MVTGTVRNSKLKESIEPSYKVIHSIQEATGSKESIPSIHHCKYVLGARIGKMTIRITKKPRKSAL
jgi:hypothetical protein